jgi:sugar lactone lactonase YvrE
MESEIVSARVPGSDAVTSFTILFLKKAAIPMQHVSAAIAVLLISAHAYSADFIYPLGAVRTEDGTLLVVDRKLPGVWQKKADALSHLFKGSKQFRTPLNAARCIALDKDGNVLAGDTSTREVYRFTLGGDGKPEPLTNGGIGMPMAIAVDPEGTIFVADLELHRIFRIPHAGGKAEIVTQISAPRGVAFNSKGELIVVSTTKDQLLKMSPEGKVSTIVPGRPFSFPHNVAVGPDDAMYVTDGYGKCVWKVTPGGEVSKFAEDAAFSNPVGIWLAGETLLVTDPRANAVFEVTLDGAVSQLGSSSE